MFTMLLILGVLIAVVAYAIGTRAARRPPPANLDQPGPGFGAQYDPGNDPRYAPQAPQPGVGSHVMGGLATGLAVGAGALAAQEIGRRMLDDGHAQHGTSHAGDFHPATDSQLAHDAGIDSVDGAGSWSDAGSYDGGGDGGGDS